MTVIVSESAKRTADGGFLSPVSRALRYLFRYLPTDESVGYYHSSASPTFAASVASASLLLTAIGKSPITPERKRRRMAERVGFEPTERFPVHSISSAANSTTLAPLHENSDE
jgi:hypothetical protein